MLCVFGNKLHGKAADYDEDDELLLSSPAKRAKASSSEEENEEEAYTQLEALSRSLPNRMRAYVVEHAFGGGTNGIS